MGFEREFLFEGETYFGRSELTDEQKMLKGDIEKLEKTMIQRRRQNFTDAENREFYEDRMFQIQQDFYLRNQSIAEDLKKELEVKKQQYYEARKKNAAVDFVELQRLQLKYSAMSDEELQTEAGVYLRQPDASWGLDRLQVLNAELRKRGIEKIGYSRTIESEGKVVSGPVREQSFGAWIQELKGDQPWLAENPDLIKALRLYDCPYGEFAALTEDGAVVPDLEIEKVYVPPK